MKQRSFVLSAPRVGRGLVSAACRAESFVQSEALLGRWMASRPGVRDRVKISTKVGCEPTVVGRFPETAEGLSAEVIKSGIEGSLRRLGTDHVELYWAHKPDPATPLEETVAAFDELVSAGTVGRLGGSNYPVWQIEQARQVGRDNGAVGFTAVQQHHTYLQPRPATPPTVVHRFGAVTAAETGTNRNRVVLAWLTGGNPAATPIAGVSTVKQLDEAVAGVSLELTAEQRERLDSAG